MDEKDLLQLDMEFYGFNATDQEGNRVHPLEALRILTENNLIEIDDKTDRNGN